MNSPFFIVGSGRSGSTLLRVMLCAHSKIAIPPETYFIKALVEQLPIHAGLDQKQTEQAINIITTHYRWPDMGISKDYLVTRLAKVKAPSLSDITNIIYEYHLIKDNKQIWGDKTPPYVSIVPQLLDLYPDAKIIHLIRDGRDVTKSFQSTGWFGPWIMDNTKEWREAIEQCNLYKRDYAEIDIYEVKYESLVLDTNKTIKDLCGFMGIDFEENMLNWESSIEGKIPAREAHIHKKLGRKPRISDIARWRTEMTRKDIIVTESFIWRGLESSGYELYFRNRVWKAVFFVIRQFNYIFIPVYSFLKRAAGFINRHLPAKA